MTEQTKRLANGVVLRGMTKTVNRQVVSIGWYGAQHDGRGGLFHGVYSIDVCQEDGTMRGDSLKETTHGYTTAAPAEEDAKAAVRGLLGL